LTTIQLRLYYDGLRVLPADLVATLPPPPMGGLADYIQFKELTDRFLGQQPKRYYDVLTALERVIEWWDSRAVAGEATQGQGHSPGTDPFADLRRFARDRLKGQERAVIEALCTAGGELPIEELAIDPSVDWSDPFKGFESAQRRLNPKIAKHGWRLTRQGNAAHLMNISPLKTR
jgi:hypothetical protein